MSSAKGGDAVTVSGIFGRTDLYNRNYSSLVTIDATGASFTDTLVFGNVSNIAVIGGSYGSATALTSWGRAIVVSGASNVSFANLNIVGFYGGQGIMISNATNASVTGATLSKLDAGIIFGNVVGGSISNNQSVGSTSDGIDVVSSSHIDVAYNSCTGGTPTTGAHPDCVQLWSSPGTARQDHIAIHDNYASGATQGFTNFASFDIGSDYISMINNRVDGYFSQGVACYSCSNSIITGNVMTSLDGAPYQVHLSYPDGYNNIIAGNVMGSFNAAAARPFAFYDRDQLIAGSVNVPVVAPLAGAVPEPDTWAMLIAGFTFVGARQRRQRPVAA